MWEREREAAGQKLCGKWTKMKEDKQTADCQQLFDITICHCIGYAMLCLCAYCLLGRLQARSGRSKLAELLELIQ